MKVLVVEGRQGPTNDVAERLVRAKHEVIRGATREGAKSLLHAREPEILVLVALPLRSWHRELMIELLAWERTPYSLAVTQADAGSIVALLEAGADVACSYPVAAGYLEAQVAALGRRAQVAVPEAPIPEVVTVRDLTVDNARYQVFYAGTRLALTPAEFRILAYLSRRPGRVVPTETLSTEALGGSAGAKQAKDVLRVHVRRIRNKISEAGGSSDYIWNIRGVGYMLERRAGSGRGRQPEETVEESDDPGGLDPC